MDKTLPISDSQNFLKSEKLAQYLVQTAKYTVHDTVIEIGAGQGILTKYLTRYAGKVVAFELDPKLYTELVENFPQKNLQLIKLNFLKADLLRYTNFKVFANIPFFLTAAIVQKLLFEDADMEEARLFMEQDAAHRFMGGPYADEGIIPLLIRPFWDLEIIHRFSKFDFLPEPNAKVVMLKIKKKQITDVPLEDKHLYFDFISYLINLRKPQIKNALLQLFSFNQLKIMSKNLSFDLNSTPTQISYQQWLEIFNIFKKYCPVEKRADLIGAYAKIQRHQHKLNREKKIKY